MRENVLFRGRIPDMFTLFLPLRQLQFSTLPVCSRRMLYRSTQRFTSYVACEKSSVQRYVDVGPPPLTFAPITKYQRRPHSTQYAQTRWHFHHDKVPARGRYVVKHLTASPPRRCRPALPGFCSAPLPMRAAGQHHHNPLGARGLRARSPRRRVHPLLRIGIASLEERRCEIPYAS